jgi:DNA-binding NarL/FixJ family response regulator
MKRFICSNAVVIIEITTDQRRSTDVSGRDQATTERPGQIRRHLAGPDDSLGSGSHNLSALDVKILAMVAEGHQIDAIAQCLNFSPRTVRRRLREMCDRLGARAPVQLAVWAARCGII